MDNNEQVLNSYKVKILGTSSFQLLFLIPWIVMIVLVTKGFNDYGWGINQYPGTLQEALNNSTLPINVQLERTWLVILSATLALLWARSIYLLCKLKITSYYYTIGFFSWVLIPYYCYDCYKNNSFKIFWIRENFDFNNNESISFELLLKDIHQKSLSKISKNTIFYIFVLTLYLIAFLFINIPILGDNKYLDEYWTYNCLCYFTHLSNILCFFFLIAFPFIQKKRICRDNTILINLSTYITVVGLIYWVALFPFKISNGSFAKYTLQHQVESIWLHAITPIAFVAFFITSASNNLMHANNKLIESTSKMVIYPGWFGLIAYSLPFMVRESVYGEWTNINPLAYVYSHYDFVKNGNLIYILVIPGIALVFFFFMWLYRTINNAVVKNHYTFNYAK